ncbi:hypothetical protein, partial [Pseudomonas aeruginosa]|uniref:hypothetical protein n=1 Tax=Pseudomonas aeruginosa TaxID=287 RepID=UPI0021F215A5
LATANLPASLTVNSLFPNIPRRTFFLSARWQGCGRRLAEGPRGEPSVPGLCRWLSDFSGSFFGAVRLVEKTLHQSNANDSQ